MTGSATSQLRLADLAAVVAEVALEASAVGTGLPGNGPGRYV